MMGKNKRDKRISFLEKTINQANNFNGLTAGDLYYEGYLEAKWYRDRFRKRHGMNRKELREWERETYRILKKYEK